MAAAVAPRPALAARCPVAPIELPAARFALAPDVNMNAAVFVNGSWIGDGGSFAEPVAHNFNRPLYFQFPPALLRPGKNEIDVLLFAYAHHFGRLAPVWVGPHATMSARYESAFFRQIVLAQLGTALAAVTAVFIAVI